MSRALQLATVRGIVVGGMVEAYPGIFKGGSEIAGDTERIRKSKLH